MKVIVKRVITETYEFESTKWDDSTKYEDAKAEVIYSIDMCGIDGTTAKPVDVEKIDYIDNEEI